MVQVQFNDEYGYKQSKVGSPLGTPKMVAWLMNAGVVKNVQQANIVLITIAVIAAGAAVYIVSSRITPAPSADFEQLPGFEEEFGGDFPQ